MKVRNVFVTFMLMSVVLALLVGVSGATWCDTDFAKRINVSVNNTGGSALTDYQVYVNLSANPINETSIRVYNSSDCASRPHWSENTTAGNSYGIWINYSAVAVSSWTNDTAIYYDNTSVNSVSDGTSTFPWFDDFNRVDNATVGNGWTEVVPAICDINQSSLRTLQTSEAIQDAIWKAHGYSTGKWLFESTIKTTDLASHATQSEGIYFQVFGAATNQRSGWLIQGNATTANTIYYLNLASGWANSGLFCTPGVKQKYGTVCDFDGGTADYYFEREAISTNNGMYTSTDTNMLHIAIKYLSGESQYIDNTLIRKFSSPEPSSTLGSEENQPQAGNITITNKQPTSPILKSSQATNFAISATISEATNNSWEINRTGSYEHLEWDNSTTAPAYTFSPQTEGVGTYKVKLTAYNTTVPTNNASITWSITVSNITISSPLPGLTDTKYVSNRTVTYSATPNRTANCSWKYQNGTLIEWDNSTVSPSMELWINSSSTTAFNITLTAYDYDYPTDYNSTSWNNSITDNVFDYTNYTWSRLSSWNRNFVGRVGNVVVGDVDNDGTDEFIAIGSQVDNDILVYEFDGSYKMYDSVTTPFVPFLFGSVHDVDMDGTNELMLVGVETSLNGWRADLFRFNTTAITDSKKNTQGTTKSNVPKDICWVNISNQEHFYTTGCGLGDTVDAFINFTTHSFNEIDDFSNSGESTMVWDIDGDGDLELFSVEGWNTNAAKVWLYELNYNTGNYITKTLLFDNDLANAQHYSAEVGHGDIDNDGIDNLIIGWRPTHYGEGFRLEAYEFDGISIFGEGNYSEGFFIDDLANNSQIGFSDGSSHAMFVTDINADTKNELISGSERTASHGSYLFRYDISNNGSVNDRSVIANFPASYFSTSQHFRSLTPNTIEYNGRTRIIFALDDEQTTTGTTEFFMVTANEGPATTPIISNVQNGSVSPTQQYVNWTVNQTTHNRVVYSNESDLTPAYYSTWDNSTAAPNITLSALEASTQYWYQAWSYNATNTSLSDNSSTLSFTTTAATAEMTITLLSQTPATLFQNTTSYVNQTWGILHNSTGLNNSTLTYIYHNIYDSDAHHSLRLPLNDRATNGWRGDSRNGTGNVRLTEEGNTTIFGSNYWAWSGIDYNKSRMSIEPVNSTYTKIHINGTAQDMIFSNSWYLDRTEMDAATKTVYDIKKQSQLLVKIHDTEMMQCRDRNYTISIWIDTVDNPTTILDPLEMWWANASFDPTAGTALTASPYAVKMTEMTDDDWETWQYNTTNSHYMRFSIYAGADPVTLPTNESYLFFKHDYPRPYKLNVTNVATTTNRSFAQTNVAWTSSFNHPTVYTPYAYTPNMFLSFHRGNQTFESKLWVADNNSLWGNSSLEQSDIGQSGFAPTAGSFEHFVFYGYNDTTMDCTYRGNISVYLQTGRDADGGNCTNNLTLCYTNGTYVATINNTFNSTPADTYKVINFNTTPFYSTSELYTLKLVTTDDEFDSVTTDLPKAFSLSPLGTTGAMYDTRPYAGRLVFWGIPDIPTGYTLVNNDNLLSYNATTDEYILKTSFHQSQYGDTFYANETTRVVSYNNDSTPFYRWTGNQVTTNMTITSWNETTNAPVTSADEYRTYVYSDLYYSRVTIKDSNMSYLGNGEEPYRGVYIGCGEDAIINNNTIMHNDQGLSVWGGGNFTISNNTITDPLNYSISITNTTGNVTIRDNIINSDVDTRGISTIHGGADNEFINNTITGSAQSGFYNQYLTDSTFRDNTMNNVQNGIVLSTNCDNITIKDNNITVEMDVLGNPAWGITIMSGAHTIRNNTINATDGYGIVMSNLYTSIPCVDSLMLNNSIKTTTGTHTDAGAFADYVMNMNSTGNVIRDPYDATNSISINNDISDIRIENTDNVVFSEDSNNRTYAHLTNFSLYANTIERFNVTQLNMTATPTTDALGMWNVEWDATVKFNASSVTGVNPTWYNITNATWATETVDIYRNNSLFANEIADANGTITYNYSDSYSQKYFEFQVQGATVNYTPPDPTTLQNTTGNYWVNYTWVVGVPGNITDSYNVSWNLTWYNTTLTAYMKKEVGASNWANVTVYAFNSSGNGTLSAGSLSDNVHAPAYAPGDYPPATPTTLANTTGNDWVNYTWSSGGAANVTDSYNVSWNLTWYNTTLTAYMNDTVGEFGWANITVWAYNVTGNGSLSAGSVSNNTQAGGGTFTTSMGTTVYNLITYYGSATSTAEQFGADIGGVDYVAMYNGSFYSHTMSFSANNFTTYHGIGYYVYLNASGSSTYSRNNISGTPYNTQLFNRWNTVGWTNATDTNAEGVASSIGSACKYTSSLNADGITYTTHTVGFTSNNHAVEKGEGYWIWTNANTNWGRNS